MRWILAAAMLALGLCAPASATDWPGGQCPVGGPFNPYPAGTIGGTAGPSNCNFGSGQVAATFSDTLTFGLGNWTEFYGIWTYTSTTMAVVSGRSGFTPCNRCRGLPYAVIIDSAMLDGVPMAAPVSGGMWVMGINLTSGTHTVAVTGHTTGVIWQGSRWGVTVSGVLYTLEAPPPCTDCGD